MPLSFVQTMLLLAGGLASAASAAAMPRLQETPPSRVGLFRRQGVPVPDDCTFFDTPLTEAHDCDYFASLWGISYEDFVSWNPSVGEDCSGIEVGEEYCVERNWGIPLPPTTTTNGGAEPTPDVPSPTQTGIIDTCTNWYQADDGDSCIVIADKLGGVFSVEDFIEWNPAVGSECTGLWLDYWFCVGTPDTPTEVPSTTVSETPTPTGDPVPSPTQTGIVSDCTRWYLAQSDDTCLVIAERHGTFTVEEFIEWNPAVGPQCTGLWLDYWYCVGTPDTPETPPTTTTSSTQAPLTPTGCTSAPTPTQPGAVCACSRWHEVVSGDGCWNIQDQ